MHWQIFFVVQMLLLRIEVFRCAKILASSKTLAKSHHLNVVSLTRALRSHGHDVAVMIADVDQPFFEKHLKGVPNVTLLVGPCPFDAEFFNEVLSKIEDLSYLEYLGYAMRMLWRLEPCASSFIDPLKAQAEAFAPDFAFLDASDLCSFLVAEKLGLPYAGFFTAQPLQPYMKLWFGVDFLSSRWPAMGSTFDPYRPTFLGRLGSFALAAANLAALPRVLGAADKAFRREGIPRGSWAGIGAKSRFVAVLSDPFLDLPIQLPPKVVAVGSILPSGGSGGLGSGLGEVLEASAGRSVYASFGTTGVGSATAGKLAEAWRRLPDVAVIWKVKDPSDPALAAAAALPNVRLVEWVDQNALLAHPRLGLFLTHGGHNSISEAAFHGVPVVAVPVFADQWNSAARAVHHGFGELLHKKALTPHAIEEEVLRVLEDPSYRKAAARMARRMRLFRERHTPIEKVMDLVETELRAIEEGVETWPSGLPMLPWWQHHQVDVALLAAAAILVGCAITWRALKCCATQCWPSSGHKCAPTPGTSKKLS